MYGRKTSGWVGEKQGTKTTPGASSCARQVRKGQLLRSFLRGGIRSRERLTPRRTGPGPKCEPESTNPAHTLRGRGRGYARVFRAPTKTTPKKPPRRHQPTKQKKTTPQQKRKKKNPNNPNPPITKEALKTNCPQVEQKKNKREVMMQWGKNQVVTQSPTDSPLPHPPFLCTRNLIG